MSPCGFFRYSTLYISHSFLKLGATKHLLNETCYVFRKALLILRIQFLTRSLGNSTMKSEELLPTPPKASPDYRTVLTVPPFPCHPSSFTMVSSAEGSTAFSPLCTFHRLLARVPFHSCLVQECNLPWLTVTLVKGLLHFRSLILKHLSIFHYYGNQ